MSARLPWRLGLTGGIGSGKSTVAARLGARGAQVIDADAISRACTASGGAAIPHIRQAFGDEFVTPDGALDRSRMRERAFRDPAARTLLEAIVHPLVGLAMDAQVQACEASCLVFDVPLLVESPRWRAQLDRVLIVDCSVSTQRRRVRARNGWDDATIDAVIAQQSPRDARLRAADAVIHNEVDDLDHLHAIVDRLSLRFGL